MKTQKKSYSHSVNLPKTGFPMRGDLPRREPAFERLWEERGVFRRMNEREGRDPFVLHDGPPYANGNIHIGHALNKVLKDMVVKSQSLLGRRTPYQPGWDCHGLPIEHALLKEKRMSKRAVTDLPAFRKEAAAFAERFVGLQRDEFRRLGVLGSWDDPYKTMSRRYESAVLRAFRLLYKGGYVYRGLKTVSWCVHCETALAEAEVEYKPKTSPSVYAALPILEPGPGFPFVESGAAVLIWTTTPWTLPANQAVAFHPELKYVLVKLSGGDWDGRVLLLAQARLDAVLKELGAARCETLGAWEGKGLVEAGLRCETPFGFQESFPHKESKGVLAEYVSAGEGTGVVHTAPGHGAEDFLTGRKEGLTTVCPVDHAGRFTDEAGPDLQGKQIFKEGNPAVKAVLSEAGRLLDAGNIEHSYQHCWRCKNPIAFRATEQWFLSVTKNGLRERLLKAIDEVRWVPAQGKERISTMVSTRPDWCLSRQRLWGTPIPIFHCAACEEVMADDDALEAVERRVAEHGSDFWFLDHGRPVRFRKGEGGDALVWDFMPEKVCAKCGNETFLRETDILDVWMDSGASWLAVLGEDAVPCDLYLEGSDQHRGWFQSSLVPAVALTGGPPYRTVLTHGFVLDADGRAMHKSMGNVVSPQEVISKLGADVLRLWVALADYSEDVRLASRLLAGPTDTYRKIRNTLRFLLGNVCDFDPSRDAVPAADMPGLERYVLKRLFDLDAEVRASYGAFAFRRAAIALVDFCNLTLSALYLDARKDALYTLRTADPVRRAAQTVMWECLSRIVALSAPVLSFTCEEAWQELRRSFSERGIAAPLPAAPGQGASTGPVGALADSVFLHEPEPAPRSWDDAGLAERWKPVLQLRDAVLAALEAKRADKVIGAPLAARWDFRSGSPKALEWFRGFGHERWAEITITSGASSGETAGGEDADPEWREVRLAHLGESAWIAVRKAEGPKCPRCWRYPGSADFGSSSDDPDLCGRCIRQITD